MATPQRVNAGYGRDHVSMGELLASCAAAHTLATPPLRPEPAQGAEVEESGEGYAVYEVYQESTVRRDAAA
ncbi:hypothetical protein ABZY68_19400 [Streptomyces sp. NPDC006482]|uniref:hypothetical protein n=1 Tax=Streptomyces sp. NPDC006482 TaxID=3154306 RepID=UPI0033A3B389